MSCYDSDGRLTKEEMIAAKKGQASQLKGRELKPGEMEFIVIGG